LRKTALLRYGLSGPASLAPVAALAEPAEAACRRPVAPRGRQNEMLWPWKAAWRPPARSRPRPATGSGVSKPRHGFGFGQHLGQKRVFAARHRRATISGLPAGAVVLLAVPVPRSNRSDGDSSRLNPKPIGPASVSTEGQGRLPSSGSGSRSSTPFPPPTSCWSSCPSRMPPTLRAARSTAAIGVAGELTANSSGAAAASRSCRPTGTSFHSTPCVVAR